MEGWLVTIHVTTAVLAAGVLFAVSLAVVVANRLEGASQREGVRMLLRRLALGAYYPMLGLALASGFFQAWLTEALTQGKWLHWKILAVMLLVGLGLMTDRAVRIGHARKPIALAVHIAVFLITAVIMFLAVRRPI